MRCGAVLLLVSLASCAGSQGGTVGSIPPCNAWIFLWGAADLKLDCPARSAIPVLEKAQQQPPKQPVKR